MFHNLKFDSEQDYSKVSWVFLYSLSSHGLNNITLKVMFNFYELLEI